MCVLLCANPTVYLWLDAIAARSERDMFQVVTGCCPLHEGHEFERDTLPESIVEQLPRGLMSRAGLWPRNTHGHYAADSSLESRKHPLDALANAWCRLLVLVGLRG